MSDYEDTVRSSLSNVDDQEILERLQKGTLTKQAKIIALKILDERGYKQVDGIFVEDTHQEKEKNSVRARGIENPEVVLVILCIVISFLVIGGGLKATITSIFLFCCFFVCRLALAIFRALIKKVSTGRKS